MKKKAKGMAKGGMKSKGMAIGGLKTPTAQQTGVKKLPKEVRNNMGYMNKGGDMKAKGMAKGGMKAKGMAKGGMKKKAYAKGGRVAMYNQGGMISNTGTLNTGIKKG